MTKIPVRPVAGRYAPAEGADGVRDPARDALGGGLVTVLRAPAPADPDARVRELARLRRLATTRSPHLAEVRAVELRDDEVQVVCEPLTGHRLDTPTPPGLSVTAVQRVAAELLDALDALHGVGVVHGAVRPDAVLLLADPGAPVVLLPLPLDGSAPAPAGPEDDTRAAAALLLRLLREIPREGAGDDALAAGLTRALERTGATAEDWGWPGSGLHPPTTPLQLRPAPVPLAAHPQSLAPQPAAAPTAGSTAAPPAPARRSRRRPLLLGAGAVVVTAAVVTGLALAGDPGTHPTAQRPAAPAPSTRPSATSAPAPTPTPTPAAATWDLPTTVQGLVDALTPDPGVAGPSGPRLLDTLRGLVSGNRDVLLTSALAMIGLVLDDPGLDPHWAAAALTAFATGLVPGPPGAPPSCFAPLPSPPDPVARPWAQRVLDRLPAWQGQGFPADRADRIRALAGPVTAGQASPQLVPCPPG